MKTTLIALSLLTGIFVNSVGATPYTVSASSGTLAASATFNIVGNQLSILLANTSTSDVLVPSDVLTAVFFNYAGTLTPFSALLPTGSTVVLGSTANYPKASDPANVGGEWAYGSGLSGAPGGANTGISSSGLGLFGGSNFNGVNLSPPAALDGLQYGITSAGDNLATGNTGVTGSELIKNSVEFILTGSFAQGAEASKLFSNVSFQYGTALTEPNLPPQEVVPEPSTMMLLGLGLVSLAVYGKRRMNKEA